MIKLIIILLLAQPLFAAAPDVADIESKRALDDDITLILAGLGLERAKTPDGNVVLPSATRLTAELEDLLKHSGEFQEFYDDIKERTPKNNNSLTNSTPRIYEINDPLEQDAPPEK